MCGFEVGGRGDVVNRTAAQVVLAGVCAGTGGRDRWKVEDTQTYFHSEAHGTFLDENQIVEADLFAMQRHRHFGQQLSALKQEKSLSSLNWSVQMSEFVTGTMRMVSLTLF